MADENEKADNTLTGEEGKAQFVEDMDVVTRPNDESIDKEFAEGRPEEAETDGAKRGRSEEENDGEDERAAKKPNLERSVEEERLGELEAKEEGREGGEDDDVKGTDLVEDVRKEESEPVGKVGPKSFSSSVEMFDYFYKLLHTWPTNLDINKYEHVALLELLRKGHADASRKIGEGIQAFQVRYHPTFKSKCFFLVRVDGSADDFSFRKCVDHILPLPDNMKLSSASNGQKGWAPQKCGGGAGAGAGGGRGGGGGGGDRGHGRGRGGRGGGRGHGGRRR